MSLRAARWPGLGKAWPEYKYQFDDKPTLPAKPPRISTNFAGNTLKFDSLGTSLDGNDNPVTAPDNTITVTDPEGGEILYEYDAYGDLVAP